MAQAMRKFQIDKITEKIGKEDFSPSRLLACLTANLVN